MCMDSGEDHSKMEAWTPCFLAGDRRENGRGCVRVVIVYKKNERKCHATPPFVSKYMVGKICRFTVAEELHYR